MWGCIRGIRTLAVTARCLSRRVAAWRSVRPPRVLRRIGPFGAAIDGALDRSGCEQEVREIMFDPLV
jgi:hypothetical protein